MLSKDAGQLKDDQSSLDCSLARVEYGLVPGRSRQLERDDNADTAVVVREGLLRLDARAPGQVDDLQRERVNYNFQFKL